MSLYLVIGGGIACVLGGILFYCVRNSGKMIEGVAEYQRKGKARRKIDAFARKRRAKSDRDASAPDKLEPWL